MKEKFIGTEGFYTCEVNEKGVHWSNNLALANGVTLLGMGASLLAALSKSTGKPPEEVASDMVRIVNDFNEWLEGKDE